MCPSTGPWETRVPSRVAIGPGVATQLPGIVADHGHRTMIVIGGSPQRYEDVISRLRGDVGVLSVAAEPTIDTVQEALTYAKLHRPQVIVGLGGGSAIDTAKAVGSLLGQSGQVEDFLEVVGAGKPVAEPGIPVVALPTTSGAGTEITTNAVLAVPEHSVKVSLRGPAVQARIALVDPLLTLTCPPAVTASSGMDAMAQCLEPLVSVEATPFSDAFAREGLRRAAGSLLRAYQRGEDVSARTEMSLAGTLGGLALTHAKLGAVHGLAGVLGGLLGAAHGAICARLLPPVVATTIQALRQRRPDSPALDRYEEAASICVGRKSRAEELAPWLAELIDSMEVPRLASIGWDPTLTARVIEATRRSSSMQGHPLPLTIRELEEILTSAA